jgi:HlyD family secretion protein
MDVGTTKAWVLRDGIATEIPVSVGLSGTDAVEIISGLVQGERVITSGADDFKSGETIRIR